MPVIGGIGFSNGAYCQATFRIDNNRVTRILYSGEKNATLAPMLTARRLRGPAWLISLQERSAGKDVLF